MIEVKESLSGSINSKQSLSGELNNAVEYLEPVTQEKIVDPTTNIQEVTPDKEYTGLSKVTINKVTSEIDTNIKPENIKEGIDILGVTGNVEEVNTTEIRITPISEEQTITPEEPYNGFNKVIVEAQSGINPEEFFDTTINSSNVSYFASRNMIKKLPKIELDSNLKTLSMAFMNLNKITSIPYMDTTNITNMNNMCNTCSLLTNFPLLNTSNVTNMNGMFLECSSIKEVPLLDTSKVTNFGSFMSNCTSLESFPELNTSSATNTSYMFSGCSSLKLVPTMNTPNVTNMGSMFSNCPLLESVGKLNCSKVVDIRSMFLNAHNNLTYLGGFENLGEAYLTSRAENYNYYTLDLSKCPNLTHESLMNVINNLYDIATKGCKPQTLTLGSTNLAKLTSDEIAIATNKGWNVS